MKPHRVFSPVSARRAPLLLIIGSSLGGYHGWAEGSSNASESRIEFENDGVTCAGVPERLCDEGFKFEDLQKPRIIHFTFGGFPNRVLGEDLAGSSCESLNACSLRRLGAIP